MTNTPILVSPGQQIEAISKLLDLFHTNIVANPQRLLPEHIGELHQLNAAVHYTIHVANNIIATNKPPGR